MTSSANSEVVAVSWRSKLGPWVSIGVSPGVLLLGAAIASRHGGLIPLISLGLGVGLIVLICYIQGLIGLVPPYGQNSNLTAALPGYVHPLTKQILSLILAFSMVGWFGFNVGLGGGALGAVTGMPDYLAAIIIGVPIIAVSTGDMRFWNALTVVTSLSSLGLILLVATNIIGDSAVAPTISMGVLSGNVFLDVAGFLGYIAVFGTRAPDFTAGLAQPRDLIICIVCLCAPMVILVLVGIGLQTATGSTDLVAVLYANNLNLGNLFVVLSIVGAAFTTVYSGSLALKTVRDSRHLTAVLTIGLPGLLLAMYRFDRYLIEWLTVLAAILPSFALAMMVETIRRSRGYSPRRIPLWTWLPGAGVACILVVLNVPTAVLIGVGGSVVLSISYAMFRPEKARNEGIS